MCIYIYIYSFEFLIWSFEFGLTKEAPQGPNARRRQNRATPGIH